MNTGAPVHADIAATHSEAMLLDVAGDFQDWTSDLTFADATEAKAHNVAMTEQTIGTSTKTFATLDDLNDYMSTLMTDLKRQEVTAQHATPGGSSYGSQRGFRASDRPVPA